MSSDVDRLLGSLSLLVTLVADEPDQGPAFPWLPIVARDALLLPLIRGAWDANCAAHDPAHPAAQAHVAQAQRELRAAIALLQEWQASRPPAETDAAR